jgi:hypothetical protein
MGAVVENVSTYTSTSLYIITVWYFIKYRDNFMISPLPWDTYSLFSYFVYVARKP